MNMLTSIIKRYALVIFCMLTIALTFAVTLLPLPGEAVPVVIVFIPAFMAIALTALSQGRADVRLLLGKLVQWRINFKWVVIALALGIIPSIQLRQIPLAQFVILVLILFIFAIPEELGWRGYVLPKLLEQRSPLVASLIIGVVWGSLHLALHLPGMIYTGLPLLPTLLQLIGFSVLITWLYLHTGGNILLTSLFHATQSFFVIFKEGVPITQLVWLMARVYLALAFIVSIGAGSGFGQKSIAAVYQVVEATNTNHPLAPK